MVFRLIHRKKHGYAVLFLYDILLFVDIGDKAVKRFSALGIALIDAGVDKNLGKDLADFFIDDLVDVVRGHAATTEEFLRPVCVLGNGLVSAQIAACKDGRLERIHLFFQAGGQHGKSHNLDKPDVFLLDMMQLRMRMVDAERILLRGDVVAQDEIQLIVVAAAARNRRDRIVRLAVCLGEDKRIRIRVAAPCAENLVREVNETRAVCAAQTENNDTL